MTQPEDISSLALNRLSVYLRCMRRLQEAKVERISSQELARRFHLSAAQIRKDLAYFGEFGIRGVGYDVAMLSQRLEQLLGLEREHPVVVVGAGNIGRALARFPGFNSGSFRIHAIVDNDASKVGQWINGVEVQPSARLPELVSQSQAEIGILAVPAEAAQENYQALVDAGIRSVLNFAPVSLDPHPGVRVKTVDLLIFLEELAYFLR